MANIKSQIKRNRQSEQRRLRNKAVRSRMRTALRRFHAAADAADRDEAETAFHQAQRALDRAATKGVIHRNQAANKKSRMARRLASL